MTEFEKKVIAAFTKIPHSFLLTVTAIFVLYNFFSLESFWLDETITHWVISGSFQDVLDRAWQYQGQSPLYFLVVFFWSKIFGLSEISLRSLSAIFLIVSTIVFVRISRKFIPKDISFIAVILLLSADSFQFMLSARPYSLAMCSALFSIYYLYKWIINGRRLFVIAYIFTSVLAIYAHTSFILVLPIHVLIWVLEKEERKCDLGDFAWSLIIIVFAILPLIIKLFSILSYIYTTFSKDASFTDLLRFYLPQHVLVALIVAALCSKIFFPKMTFSMEKTLFNKRAAILLIWLIAIPLGFYLCNQLGVLDWFLNRYLLICIPAYALLVVRYSNAIVPLEAKRFFLVALSLMILLREGNRTWAPEEWKTASEFINQSESSTRTVFSYTGLLELATFDIISDREKRDYLLSPFSAYPILKKENLLPLPPSFNGKDMYQYRDKEVLPVLDKVGEFYLVAFKRKLAIADSKSNYVKDYYIDFFKKHGFSLKEKTGESLVGTYFFVRDL